MRDFIQTDEGVVRGFWAKQGDWLKMVVVSSTAPASGAVVETFRFPADPEDPSDLPKELGIIRPEDQGHVQLPDGIRVDREHTIERDEAA